MKSRLKLASWLLVLSLGLVPTLTGCGAGNQNGAAESGDKKAEASGGVVNLKWSTWGNPGELARHQKITDDFNKSHPNIHMTLIPVPGEYDQKILTELTGGTAPDVFYSGDMLMSKLIENGSVEELTPYMEGPDSKTKPDDFYPGVWGAGKTEDGKIYGMPPDINPIVLWYNEKVLKDAGVTEMPADLYEKGQWNWDNFSKMLAKVRATNKYGYVLDNSWTSYYSFVTGNGGKIYDDKGNFVVNQDPKSKEAFKYMYDNVKNKNFTFAGTLPKGQGGDAMFMSNQVAFVSAGRWYLPIFKQAQGLQYDVVPYPTNTGKKIEPAGIAGAFVVMNKNTQHKKEAFEFITYFNSKEGVLDRLKGGGNAVPAIKGADDVVLEGNLPKHAKYFLDTREVGYVLPPAEGRVPGLSKIITDDLETLWVQNKPLDPMLAKLSDDANKAIQEYKAAHK